MTATGAAAPDRSSSEANVSTTAPGFLSGPDAALGERFLRDGYVIQPVDNRDLLDRLRGAVVKEAAGHLGIADPGPAETFLNDIHERVGVADLNDLRLAVYGGVNAGPWLREAYFSLARQSIEALVGNELAMQRRVNLSIQSPEDDSSLLPVHADVWSGDSPFEISRDRTARRAKTYTNSPTGAPRTCSRPSHRTSTSSTSGTAKSCCSRRL